MNIFHVLFTFHFFQISFPLTVKKSEKRTQHSSVLAVVVVVYEDVDRSVKISARVVYLTKNSKQNSQTHANSWLIRRVVDTITNGNCDMMKIEHTRTTDLTTCRSLADISWTSPLSNVLSEVQGRVCRIVED